MYTLLDFYELSPFLSPFHHCVLGADVLSLSRKAFACHEHVPLWSKQYDVPEYGVPEYGVPEYGVPE
jgi:hypothetical protein